MNSSYLLCKIHNKRIHSFCSAEKCENIMLCISCIFNHNKEHETKVIEIIDFNESFLISKIESIFKTIKNDNDKNYKIYESLIEEIERIESNCVSQCKEIKIDIKNIMGLINVDIRKEIVNEIRKKYNDFSKNEKNSKEENLRNIFERIGDCENSVRNINNLKFYEQNNNRIMEEFSELQKYLEEKKLKIQTILKEDPTLYEFIFDTNFKQANIEVSKDGLEAKKINGNGHQTILFNKFFSQGIHRWKLQLNGIIESDGNWIQFGVLDKADFNNSNDANSYATPYNNNSWSISSQNLFKSKHIIRMNVTGACISYKDLKFDCTLNCNEGIFMIEGNGIKAEAKNLKNRNLYPFVNFFNEGGCVKIIS